MLRNYLNYHGYNYEKMEKKIIHMILLSFFSVQHIFENIVSSLDYRPSNFFQIFGFDVIFDRKFEKPYMFELNHRDTDFDIVPDVSHNMIADTFNLVGFVPYNHETGEPFDKEYKYKNDIEENVNEALCEFNRPRGGFKKIFPNLDNIDKYSKYILNKKEAPENELLWKKMKKLNIQ